MRELHELTWRRGCSFMLREDWAVEITGAALPRLLKEAGCPHTQKNQKPKTSALSTTLDDGCCSVMTASSGRSPPGAPASSCHSTSAAHAA